MNKEFWANFFIIVFSVLYMASILVYWIWLKRGKKNKLERTNCFKSFVEISGVIVAIIAIMTNSVLNLASYKAPELQVLIRNKHGIEWKEIGYGTYDLPFTIDKNKEFSYDVCNAEKWFICLKNDGNISADEVAVEISFEDVLFPQNNIDNESYSLRKFEYGTGCYNSIYREIGQIQPGEEVMLPQILDGTISYAELFNKDTTVKNNTIMHIKIYSSNENILEYNYRCERANCLTGEDLKE